MARDADAYQGLLSELGIDVQARPSDASFVLVARDGALDLRPPGEGARSGVRAVFPPDRRAAKGGRNPLVRAFGRGIDTILDLTAGFGGDAYRLASAGHRVRAYERHPAVYAVLATGWARDCAAGRVPAELVERLEFSWGDSAEAVACIEGSDVAVYVDPMYPLPRRGKALPKRELQVLRQLLGPEDDAVQLVDAARLRAARVVVKRPHRASPLVPGADFEVATKLVRFDVYLNPEKMGTAAS